MKLARTSRSLIAWMLYGCILFSALACSIGHGQMAGLQLSGVDGVYCSAQGNSGPAIDLAGSGVPASNVSGSMGCSLCSTFAALILAAFFGLLGLLAPGRSPAARPPLAGRAVRFLWPSANPRASPFLA